MIFYNRIPRGLAVAGLAASFILTGCGGGGGDGGSIGGSASSTSVGSIHGLGSVFVNGVRFDDSAARVTDDGDNVISSNSLDLGMTVEVSGSVNDDGTGSASSINVFSEVQGPISNLNAVAGTFSILGFNVTVPGTTVFDDFSGLLALGNGNIVEVHGSRSGNAITATRIELKSPGAGDTLIKIRGQVAALNKTTSTFTIGAVTVNYVGAKISPNVDALADGGFVKVRSISAATGNTVTASRIQVVGSRPFGFADGGKSELEGVVSDFVSLSQFKVGGIAVNVPTDAIFVRGVAASIANGTRLEIKGVFNNNVITASKVKFEDGARADEFELHGVVRPFTSLSNFVVRGVTVDASGSGVLFERGLASEVADGRVIEVEGSIVSTTSGSILLATKVKFEDSTGGAGEFEFKGSVISTSGDTMVVGTRTVTLTANTVFRRMTKAQIVTGVFLEIKGRVQSDGSVIAERISLED